MRSTGSLEILRLGTPRGIGLCIAIATLVLAQDAGAIDPLGGRIRVSGFGNLTAAGLPLEHGHAMPRLPSTA
jgi:hypothetical protein